MGGPVTSLLTVGVLPSVGSYVATSMTVGLGDGGMVSSIKSSVGGGVAGIGSGTEVVGSGVETTTTTVGAGVSGSYVSGVVGGASTGGAVVPDSVGAGVSMG